jgi:hypothetical protein
MQQIQEWVIQQVVDSFAADVGGAVAPLTGMATAGKALGDTGQNPNSRPPHIVDPSHNVGVSIRSQSDLHPD